MFALLLWMMFTEPQDPMAVFKRMEGNWSVQFLQIDEAGNYLPIGSSDSEFKVLLDGKLVQETTTVKTAQNVFPIINQFSYDSVRGVYRKSSTDAVSGNMDIQEGELNNGLIHFTNTKYQTWFVTPSGTELGFYLIFEFMDADRMVMTARLSTDHGETWDDFQILHYNRVK
ncbi:MAG: DUF1579 family protein [Acidobacteria bacterium]|nr:DUF1579 family protein [Acidobacteriota bacterium]